MLVINHTLGRIMHSHLADNHLLQALHTRRSVTAKDLCDPGPNEHELQAILQAAHRVPDHKKLGPWRHIIFEGTHRQHFSEKLARILEKNSESATPQMIEFEKQRFLQAPLIIAVISSPIFNEKAPEWEQVLSAGAACQNILHAVNALNYGAQWLSEWYAYDKDVHILMGLKDEEKIAGFIYIGSYDKKPKERSRPELETRIERWHN